ncbi:MAG: hypothetical protein ACR2PX_05395, partial [Endozoicomonas sp.]|uniref:hypothetical protein n=1 Tax=Endozoicomonas sp. TaxID=1892382 RepID=UPI003D9B0758
MEIAAEYFGKAVSALTSASNYINGVVAPAAEPVASTIAQLQTSAAAQLPETVTSTLGKEVAVEGLGSTTAGAVVALAGPTVLPIVNYLWKGWGRSSELSDLKTENQQVLLSALAKSDKDIDGAIESIEKQTAKINLMTREHNKNTQDSFFSFKNMLKHTVTVLAPFCVLPQVGFAVAGTAALVGLTTRAVTHVLNHRGEASQVTAEQKSATSLRQLRNRLQELKDTHEEKIATEANAVLQGDLLANAATLIEQQNDGIARRDAEIEVLRNRPDEVAIVIEDGEDDDELLQA